MKRQEKLRGIAVSPGFANGQVHLVTQGIPKISRYHLMPEHLPEERQRLLHAIELSRQQLQKVRDRLACEGIHQELLTILDAHALILEDKTLRDGILAYINNNVNAEWAVTRYLSKVIAVFKRMEDSYLREKKSDIEQVGKHILNNLIGDKQEPSPRFSKPVILISKEFSPSDTLLMNHEKVLGFVTQWGGITSHTAILAKSLGIPAIVGVQHATTRIQHGDSLVVDGISGWLYIHPEAETIAYFEERRQKLQQFRSQLMAVASLPTKTWDGHKISLKANIELSADAHRALQFGADGIGLYRTEHLYMNRYTPPDEEELYLAFREAVETMAPGSVSIRTMDIGGEKQSDLLNQRKSYKAINPALGLQAIRLCLGEERPAFIIQLRALLRASIHGNLKILFPMISGIDELKEVLHVLHETREVLRQEGVPFSENIPVGAMVEIPSAALCADELASCVDFLSIGTNDLIQFTLAVDRLDESVAYLYEPTHPAVLRLIKMTVEAARRAQIPVTLCGEMAGDPRYAMLLLGLGLDELSVVPSCLPLIRRTIRGIEHKRAVDVAQVVLGYGQSAKVVTYLEDVMREAFGEDHMFH